MLLPPDAVSADAVSTDAVSAAAVSAAAAVLRGGGLVALPTETVYGLGADASNDEAVRRIYAAKGRPATHPLIVHVAGAALLDAWAQDVPAAARTLAERFWPGPLTLILRKRPTVSSIVTGGLDTVAVRVPDHAVALALLAEFAGGIAAPSANRFGAVSPTTAADVAAELGDRVDFILDGGPCRVGVESTIVDVSAGPPVILRPGGLTREAIEAALGAPVPVRQGQGGPVRAPGQHPSHYAPSAQVVLCTRDQVNARASALLAQGLRVGILTMGESGDGDASAATRGGDGPDVRTPSEGTPAGDLVLRLALPASDEGGAARLYEALRAADHARLDVVLAVPPAAVGLGLAVVDRLQRAAGPRSSG